MTDSTKQDVYERLGVRKLINAHGTLTRLGGSRMAPEVMAAMAEATRHFVDLNELLEKSGAYVAELIGVEAAYISAGAAAGLALATAACVAGADPARIHRLPDTRGMPNRVAVHRSHRMGYDHAVRQVGVELVEFGYARQTYRWQLEEAIDEQTAAVLFVVEFAGEWSLPLETVIEIAHRRDVPVIVDPAAEIPPVSNLRHFNHLGADLVTFSGGKDIEGPQCTGLILGRADLIRACVLNAQPHYSLGRSMKVGKEEIIGQVAALERYLEQDREAQDARWHGMVDRMVEVLSTVPGVRARSGFREGPGVRPVTIPRAFVGWDMAALHLTVEEAADRLLAGKPSIAVDQTQTELMLNPQTLSLGEERVVAEGIARLLSEAQGGA